MRVLVRNWIRVGADLLRWGDNPFLVLELHRARRRDWLPIVLGLELLIIGLSFAACTAGSLVAGTTGTSPAWGGSVGWLVAILLSLFHMGSALLAAALRGGDWVTREANSGTLELLLAAPMTPTQMVLRRAAYPFLSGMLASLLPLPFYVFSSALGGPSLATLIAFYFLVTLLVISASGVSRFGQGGAQSRWGGGSLTGALVLGFLFITVLPQLMMLLGPMGWGWNPLALPLALADWLAEPQTFFLWRLPPLLVALALFPVWLGGTALRWARRLDFEGRLGVPAARVRSALLLLLVFVALGYGWSALVTGGRAGDLVVGTDAGAPVRGLVLGLVLAAVLLAVVDLAMGRTPDLGLLGMSGHSPGEGASPADLLRFGLLNTLSVLVVPVGLVLAACLLSGTALPAADLAFGGKVLLSGGAMLLYLLGVSVFAWGALAGRGSLQTVFTVAWYVVSLALPLLALLKPYVPWNLAPAAIFSPLGGVLDLAAPVRFLHSWSWGQTALVHAALGVAGVAGGWEIWRYRYRRYERQVQRLQREAEEAALRPRPVVPLGVVMQQAAMRLQNYYDNPLMVEEVRRGFRRSGWRALAITCGVVAAAILWLLVRAALRGAWMRTGCPGLSFTMGLARWQGILAAWPIEALGLPGVLALVLPLGPAGSALARRRREGTLPFLVMTPLKAREIVTGIAVAALYPVALCLLPVLAVGLLSSVLSLSPMAISATLALAAWIVGLAVAMAGLTLLGAGMSDFGPSAEGVGGGLALFVVVLAEVVKFAVIGILIAQAAPYRDIIVHLGLWVGAGAEVGLGLLGLAGAAGRLARVWRRDIPTEGTVG